MSRRTPGAVRARLLPVRVLLAPALVATVLVAPSAPAVAAEKPVLVAMGDSYSSGTGIGDYVDDGTSCLRSPLAYPSLVAARGGYTLNLRACSGADVADVRATQIGALKDSTDLVTISVGGNDAGFADVLTTCALPWWWGNCTRAVRDARSFIDTTLPARLDGLYAEIRKAAPGASVVVAGYPRIFGGEDCNPLTFFSRREMSRLNAAADRLNRRVREAAARAGFAFANPTGRFVGHAVCADDEWINDLTFPVVESYHPNSDGHERGYLPTVESRLPAAVAVRPGARRTGIPASEIAASQRRYARLDARIEPRTVSVPDLTTPQARKAARRAGVDLDRWIARQRR